MTNILKKNFISSFYFGSLISYCSFISTNEVHVRIYIRMTDIGSHFSYSLIKIFYSTIIL